MNYGRAIRIVRTAYGMSQGELAEQANISPSHLSLVEAGRREPSLKVLKNVAAGLSTPLHLLTLLASNPSDLEDPAQSEEISRLAKTLLRILVSAGDQPNLPMTDTRRKRKTA